MAVGVIQDFEGATLAQYDRMIEKMGFTEGIGAPDGVFHWVARTGTGIRVVDVWTSRAAFQKFAETQIGPLSQEIGVPTPTVTILEIHNILVGPDDLGISIDLSEDQIKALKR